ncbi:hypothetical protein JCM10449v2_003456 [Rhodotorula kratochvilovae]
MEHQKLVWPVHKLVCGVGKANPFLWPKLTAKEADDAIKHKDVRIFDTTPITELIEGFGVPSHGVDDKIKDLSELSPPADEKGVALEQLLIANVRLFEEERTFLPQKTDGEPEFAVTCLRSMTSWVGKLDHDFLTSIETPAGRTPFLHRILVFYALMFSPRGTESRALSSKAWAQVAACFDKDLQTENRGEAQQLVQVMGEAVETESALSQRIWEVMRGQ